jgi:hypothetical protein
MRLLKWLIGGALASFSLFALSIHFGKVEVNLNFGAPLSAVAPRTTQSLPEQSTVQHLKCMMRAGPMDQKTYSFSIDPVARKAAWADYGMALEIRHLDDLRIHTRIKLSLAGWPDHDHISFNFNRLTLTVEGALSREPSAAEVAKCRVEAKGGWTEYCTDYFVVGELSGGTCQLIQRGF